MGLVSEEGTRTAHAAILAHSLGIPAVTIDLGCKGSITFRDKPVERYRDWERLNQLDRPLVLDDCSLERGQGLLDLPARGLETPLERPRLAHPR